MIWDYSQYVLRKPRHAAADESGHRVFITCVRDETTESQPADLLDLSRDGFCLRTAAPLTLGALVTVDLRQEVCGFAVTLQGEVRWQREQDDGTYLLGCQTEQPLDWETLGELFLSNVLTVESRPDLQVSHLPRP